MERHRAQGLIFDAIDTVNRQLPQARRLEKAPRTILVGAGGTLDSLSLINFIVTLEERASEAVGSPIQLLDESGLVDENGPFRTVGSLTDFLAGLPS